MQSEEWIYVKKQEKEFSRFSLDTCLMLDYMQYILRWRRHWKASEVLYIKVKVEKKIVQLCYKEHVFLFFIS